MSFLSACACGLFYKEESDSYIKAVDVIDRVVSLITLLVFFPTFEKSYHHKESIWGILVVQVVTAYITSSAFGERWHECKPLCVTYKDAKTINALLLRHALAGCKIRFAVVAIAISAYFHFTKARCIGYKDCQNRNDGDACTLLVYSLCSCFYYTAFASQLIVLTKCTPNGTLTTEMFRCVGVALLSAALIYSVATSVEATIAEADGFPLGKL